MFEDIYFEKDYLNLYTNNSNTFFEYERRNDDFFFRNDTIRRTINNVGDVSVDSAFDLESAYGYGGYRTNADGPQLAKFLNDYSIACGKEGIVAEFIRFHPFNDFPIRNPEYFEFLMEDRKTVSVDLNLDKDSRWKTYDANTRNILRKTAKSLVLEESEDIELFISLYNETMDRNQASSFYYFDHEYFRKLMNLPSVRLYMVYLGSDVVCSSFVLYGKKVGHYHLSASRREFSKHNGNYFLLDSIFDVAKGMGLDFFHLGGGRSNRPDDTLLAFKRKFSPILHSFYIAGKIFNKNEYHKLCESWIRQNGADTKYFLKYRLPLNT